MQAVSLAAKPRDITGKKVKKLRKEGFLPVSLYGKDVKSMNLAVAMPEFMKVYGKVGETGLVDLKYDGGSQSTLIANVQMHPVTRAPLHAEFRAVKLTEKIKANVPVELVGESPAVANNIGLLLQTVKEIEVEALPTDLPEKIEVDAAKLAEVDQRITVAELPVPKEVTVLTEGSEIVVKVVPAVSEETKKELEAEEAAKAAAAAEAGAAPGEPAAPAEGETPAAAGEEKKPEEKPSSPAESTEEKPTS